MNINETVKVKLTETGIEHYKKEYMNDPIIDKDGYTSFQLWTMMNLFGEFMYLGCVDLPFETEIKIGDE